MDTKIIKYVNRNSHSFDIGMTDHLDMGACNISLA